MYVINVLPALFCFFFVGSHRLNRLAIPSQNLPRAPNKSGSDYQSFQTGFTDASFHSFTDHKYDSDATKEQDVLEVYLGKEPLTDDVNNNLPSALSEECSACNATNDTPDVGKCSASIQVAGPSTADLPLTTPAQPSTELDTTCEKTKIHLILSDLLESNEDINTWTGIQSMELLQEICLAAKKLECSVYAKTFKMHCTDRVILVLVKLKQNLTFAALGTLFKISPPTVGRYFGFTVQILCQILERFVYMPPKEEIRENIPLCFRGKFSNVTMILDCTEVPVATLKCLNCRISMYSHYKSRRTVKIMIGVTPAGLISFYSSAYTGKASDKFIFNSENLIDRFEAHMDEIMVDKGFNIDNEVTTKGIKLHIPPRLKSNQLTPEEAGLNESIAKARVHVERIMQRLKIFSVLQHTIDNSILGHIDDIIAIVCGLVNLSNPILRDDKF